jgi:hypothetical protein
MSLLRSKWTLVALLVLGCGLMLPFELWATRLAGMACLLAFIVLGVFLIADPRFLAEDREGGGKEIRSGWPGD